MRKELPSGDVLEKYLPGLYYVIYRRELIVIIIVVIVTLVV